MAHACDAFGGMTDGGMFTFSAAYGCRIEKGKQRGLVRDMGLTGNIFETLRPRVKPLPQLLLSREAAKGVRVLVPKPGFEPGRALKPTRT